MQERNLYLVISYSGTFPAQLIRLFTRKTYSHSSISLDKSLDEIYSFGRKKVNNPYVGGFIIEKIGEGVYRKFPDTECKILELPVTEESYRKAVETISRFIAEKERYKYSIIGIFLALIGKNHPRPYRFYCSEFVRKVLQESGVDVSMIPAVCKPTDFFNLPNSRLIYSGKLNAYSCEKPR